MSGDGENTRYLVRGAVLRCTMGSHPRQLNMPKSHGTFIKDNEKAFANKNDCIGEYDSMSISEIQGNPKESNTPIEECNIRMFGICKSGSNPSTKDDVKFACFDSEGNETETPASGKQCYVQIDGPWEEANDTVIIKDENGHAITVDSRLKCKFGGIIYVADHGQEK